MHISVSFHIASPTQGNVGNWGNSTVSTLLQDFPILTSLVTSLQSEKKWSGIEKDLRWTAVFFVEYKIDKRKVYLEMRSHTDGISVPMIPLSLEEPPSIKDVQAHILGNLRTTPDKESVRDEEIENPSPKPVLM